jgi:hypothetical protein
MKRTFFVILILGLISLSSFIKESSNYEQITFDYFVSDVLGNDFLTKGMCHSRSVVLHYRVSFIISFGVVGQIREGRS